MATAAGLALNIDPSHADSTPDITTTQPMHSSNNLPQLPRRPYGKNGWEISIIGMGGIVVMDAPQDHANRTVAAAIERGVNYFDVAPIYGDAEVKLGPALQPYRNKSFLACKTGQRKAPQAKLELEQSFERLRTDYFDLYQLHGITHVENDVDAAFAPDGVMPMLIDLKKHGRIHHIGFSAHSVEAALAAMDRYPFDSILLPVNFACQLKGNFGNQVIEVAQQKKITCLALKTLARQKWPENDPLRQQHTKCWYQPITDPQEALLALRYTLSQPVAAILPPGDESLFWSTLELAMKFQPITPQQLQQLHTLAQSLNPVFSVA
jgi:aryl-alcohol dehydrogenase-like predicted oxidoreductase